MLSPSVIRDIQRLLEEGKLSRRKIAKKLGVAHSTVAIVASDARKADDYLDAPPARDKVGKPRKCPSCHAIVQMPCKLCQTRELMAGNHLEPLPPIVDTPIGLDLKPEHEARYAEVRRWRREALRLGVVKTPRYDPNPP